MGFHTPVEPVMVAPTSHRSTQSQSHQLHVSSLLDPPANFSSSSEADDGCSTSVSVIQFPHQEAASTPSFTQICRSKSKLREEHHPPPLPPAPTLPSPPPTGARMTMAIHQRRPSALFVLARVEVRRFAGSRISIIVFLPAERHLLSFFFFLGWG